MTHNLGIHNDTSNCNNEQKHSNNVPTTKYIPTRIEDSTRNVVKYVDTLRWNEVKNEQ